MPLTDGELQNDLREKTRSSRCGYIYLTLLPLTIAQQDDDGFAHNGPGCNLFLQQSLEPVEIKLIEQQAEDRILRWIGDVAADQFDENFAMVFGKTLHPTQRTLRG